MYPPPPGSAKVAQTPDRARVKDYDGTFSSFYRFSFHNPFCDPTPLSLS